MACPPSRVHLARENRRSQLGSSVVNDSRHGFHGHNRHSTGHPFLRQLRVCWLGWASVCLFFIPRASTHSGHSIVINGSLQVAAAKRRLGLGVEISSKEPDSVHCQRPMANCPWCSSIPGLAWSGLVRSECHSVDGCGWRLRPSNLSTGMQDAEHRQFPIQGDNRR